MVVAATRWYHGWMHHALREHATMTGWLAIAAQLGMRIEHLRDVVQDNIIALFAAYGAMKPAKKTIKPETGGAPCHVYKTFSTIFQFAPRNKAGVVEWRTIKGDICTPKTYTGIAINDEWRADQKMHINRRTIVDRIWWCGQVGGVEHALQVNDFAFICYILKQSIITITMIHAYTNESHAISVDHHHVCHAGCRPRVVKYVPQPWPVVVDAPVRKQKVSRRVKEPVATDTKSTSRLPWDIIDISTEPYVGMTTMTAATMVTGGSHGGGAVVRSAPIVLISAAGHWDAISHPMTTLPPCGANTSVLQSVTVGSPMDNNRTSSSSSSSSHTNMFTNGDHQHPYMNATIGVHAPTAIAAVLASAAPSVSVAPVPPAPSCSLVLANQLPAAAVVVVAASTTTATTATTAGTADDNDVMMTPLDDVHDVHATSALGADHAPVTSTTTTGTSGTSDGTMMSSHGGGVVAAEQEEVRLLSGRESMPSQNLDLSIPQTPSIPPASHHDHGTIHNNNDEDDGTTLSSSTHDAASLVPMDTSADDSISSVAPILSIGGNCSVPSSQSQLQSPRSPMARTHTALASPPSPSHIIPQTPTAAANTSDDAVNRTTTRVISIKVHYGACAYLYHVRGCVYGTSIIIGCV